MCRAGLRRVLFLCLSLMWWTAPVPVHAAPVALSDVIHATLAEHPSLVGRSFNLQFSNNSSLKLACEDWWVDLPMRERMIGAMRIQARCPSSPRLNRSLSVSVQVSAPVLVATRNLAPGQVLQAGDWKAVMADLGSQSQDTIEDGQSLENKELVRFIRAGNPIRLNDLREVTVIRTGDQVKLILVGQGFSVTATGQAMANAAVGGTVRVRTAEGKVLQGTVVTAGQVEVTLD